MAAVRFENHILSSGGIRIAFGKHKKRRGHGGNRDEVHDGGGRPAGLDGLWKIFGAPDGGTIPCNPPQDDSGDLWLPGYPELAGSISCHSDDTEPDSVRGSHSLSSPCHELQHDSESSSPVLGNDSGGDDGGAGVDIERGAKVSRPLRKRVRRRPQCMEENRFLRPIKFVRCDDELLKNEVEVYLPEIAGVDFLNPDDTISTPDLSDHIFSPEVISESSSGSESDLEQDFTPSDESLQPHEEDLPALVQDQDQQQDGDFLARYKLWKASIDERDKETVVVPLTIGDEESPRAKSLQPTKAKTPPTKKKGGLVRLQPIKLLFSKEEKRIQTFLDNPSQSTLQFSSMKKKKRKLVSAIVASYHLQCEYPGESKKRRKRKMLLTKTTKTRLIMESLQPSKAGGEEGEMKEEGEGECSTVAREPHRHHEGEVVGKHAVKIAEENVGYRLLQHMGWSEGNRIGARASGLEAPLEAIFKRSKLGLGAPMPRNKTLEVVVPGSI